MLSTILKNLSILKKFLLINLIIFVFIGSGTIIYLKTVQSNLIKTKAVNHIKIINNTINHIKRLKVEFKTDEIRSFLFSFLLSKFSSSTILEFFENDLGSRSNVSVSAIKLKSLSKKRTLSRF